MQRACVSALWHWGRGKLALGRGPGAWGGSQVQAAAPGMPPRLAPRAGGGSLEPHGGMRGWLRGSAAGVQPRPTRSPSANLNWCPAACPLPAVWWHGGPGDPSIGWLTYARDLHRGPNFDSMGLEPGAAQAQRAGDEAGRNSREQGVQLVGGWSQVATTHAARPHGFHRNRILKPPWFVALGIARVPWWAADQRQEAGEPPNAPLETLPPFRMSVRTLGSPVSSLCRLAVSCAAWPRPPPPSTPMQHQRRRLSGPPPCAFHLRGHCRFGTACRFSHEAAEQADAALPFHHRQTVQSQVCCAGWMLGSRLVDCPLHCTTQAPHKR